MRRHVIGLAILCIFCGTASAQRVLTLTAPVGGENWISGSHNVTWQRTGTGWQTGDTLQIEYSPNAGTSWTQLTNTVLASADTYGWNVDGLTPGPLYRVRITCVQDAAATGAGGMFRIGSTISYYVNDGSTVNDKYCTAAGSDSNNGTTPGTPKASIQAIIDTYDLEPGDTVYVDTGTYVLTANITVGLLDGGASGNPVTFVGASEVDGTLLTVLDRNAASVTTSRVFDVSANYVRLEKLRCTRGYYGVSLNATGGELRNCEVYACGDQGIYVGGTGGMVADCLVRNNTGRAGIYITEGNTAITGNTVRDNTGDGILTNNGSGNNVAVSNNVSVNNGARGLNMNTGNHYLSAVTATNNTLAGNVAGGAVYSRNGLGLCTFRNNIIHTGGVGKVCFSIESTLSGTLDYNTYYATGGAGVGYNAGATRPTLGEWRTSTGQDTNSLNVDPMFVDVANGDYHLQSKGGSWHGGAWTADAVTSPCIDAGQPTAPIGAETTPNGNRVNQGFEGGTAQASRTPSQRILALLAPRGGEQWPSGVQTIRWQRTGSAWTGSETLTVEYSANAGASWTVLNASASAALDSLSWDVTGLSGGPLYRVRITCNQDGSAADGGANFAVGTSLSYYVNDGSTVNDKFCSAAGNAANDGLSPGTPKDSVQSIIDTYDLEPGDTVYVDTGTYLLTANITIGATDGGASGNPVKFVGATESDGTLLTVLDRNAASTTTSRVLDVTGTYVRVERIKVTRGYYGISMVGTGDEALNCEVYGCGNTGIYISSGTAGSVVADCLVRDNTGTGIHGYGNSTIAGNTVRDSTGDGIYVDNTGNACNVVMSNNVLVNNGSCGLYMSMRSFSGTFTATNNTMAGNGSHGTYFYTEYIGVCNFRNNIVHTDGAGKVCFYIQAGSGTLDYNTYYATGGAGVGYNAGATRPTLGEWRTSTGQDAHSLTVNPLLMDTANGDYHLSSTAGSWHGGAWQLDAVSSPCIDAGASWDPFVNETAPNGGRINMGVYGNTPEASRTPSERLLALTAPVGGENWFSGTQTITWQCTGLGWQIGDTIRIEYSSNDGMTWTSVSSAVAAANLSQGWIVDALTPGPLYRIRTTCNQDTSVTQTSRRFRVGTDVAYYVNDASPANDVYCTAVGNDANDGVTPATPKATVQAVLDAYDLEGGDTVYVDTGTYALSANIVWGAVDGGESGKPVTLIGSTSASGTLFDRNDPTPRTRCFDLAGSYIRIQGVWCRGAEYGIYSSGTGNEVVGCELFENGSGVFADSGSSTISRCRIRNNTIYGVYISNATITATNNVIYGNGDSGVYLSYANGSCVNNTIVGSPGKYAINGWNDMYYSTQVFLRNNILIASGAGGYCVYVGRNAEAVSDYNDLYAVSGAAVGIHGVSVRATLAEWRVSTGQDAHSIAEDALFVDVANGNYHIYPYSACVDAGTNEGAPLTDMDGAVRPYNLLTDIGADEAGQPSPPVVTVGPAAPYKGDPLVCTVVSPSLMPPDVTPRYEFKWSDSTDTVTHGPTTALTDTLSPSFTAKHQTWTCSVRGFDGYYYSAPATASTTILNTPPGPISFTIPSSESTSVNLRCYFIKSPDPDGDVVYTVRWHRKRAGDANFSLWTGAVITTASFSQIDAADTTVDDLWYCETEYGDGEGPPLTASSGICRIVSGGVTNSYISLMAAPQSIVLGEAIVLSGQIFPVPADSDRRVRFFSTNPDSSTTEFPEDVGYSATTGLFSRMFYPPSASEGRPNWTIYAHWNGDSVYSQASSAAESFTVLKAQPSLSLSLSALSVPLNYGELTATATLDAPLTGSLRSLLSGRTIKLWLKKPDGSAAGPVLAKGPGGEPLFTNASGGLTFSASSFVSAGVTFNTPGTWKFQAEFEGDNNFKRVTSAGYDTADAVRLTVKDRAGYAIIVVGKLDASGEGLAQHSKTTDFVYHSFQERGFPDTDLYYMKTGQQRPYLNDSQYSGVPSQAEVQWAIQTWALGKMSVVPAPLYVVFVDHGSTGKFYIYSGNYGESWYIDPGELSGYFSTLQAGLTARGGDAGNQNIVFIYGGCHSGSFIPALSGPRRVIVTSCGEDEVSNRGVVDPGGLRDGELFTTELFGRLRNGKAIKESVELASAKTREYITPAVQTPEVDDNGQGAAGPLAASIELGYGVNAGLSTGWLTVSQTVTLASGAVMPDLLAVVDQAPPAGSSAWIEIKTPTYAGGTLVDPGNPQDSQQTVDLTRVSASSYNAGIYTWTDLNTLFQTAGTYQVFYYITDGTTHETCSHMLTTVYRRQSVEQPPTAVALLYPDDLATVPSATFFAWAPTGEAVTFRLEVSHDATFTPGQIVVVKEGISSAFAQLTVADGLLDGQTYYWHVLPVDAYGATPTSNPCRTLTVNNQNPALTTALMGVIRDSVSRAGISGVEVSVLPGPYTATSGTLGNYFVPVPADTYNISLSVTGYTPQSRSGVMVAANLPQSLDFEMVSTNAPFRWGDVSGDGKVGTVDASQILQWTVGLIDRFGCNPGIVYPQYPPLADVDGSGAVGTVDASLIIRKRVGLITAFPADHNGDGFGPDAKRLAVAKSADKTATRTISISTALTAAPGATFDVPIITDDATGVLGYLLRVEYDAALLDYVEVLPGSLTSAWGIPTVNPTAGRVVLASAGAYALTGSGSLAVVRLKVKDTAQAGQSSALHIAVAQLNDGEIPTQSSDGAIAIAIPIAIPILGDIGGDGKVDAVDVQLVINKALGLSITGDADVNKDGKIDALDIQFVINATLGIH